MGGGEEVHKQGECNERRRERKRQVCCCCRDQRKACVMVLSSAEKLVHIGLPNRIGWPKRHELSSWQGRRSLLQQMKN